MEEQKITGKVESLESKSGETNGKKWNRFTITMNGVKYSTFYKELMEGISSGSNVEIGFTNDGKYNTIKELRPLEGEIPTTQETNGQIGLVPSDQMKEEIKNADVWIQKDKRISRLSCLSTATAMFSALVQADPEKAKGVVSGDVQLVDVIVNIAEVLEDYVWKQ